MGDVMEYENLLCEIEGAIATVILNRPKVLNALDAATFRDLQSIFTSLAGDDAIRAILLIGAGDRAFAAGADIRELALVNGHGGKELSLRGQAVFEQIESCGKPVIACINGFALGGGCELALACTLRLASETAKLGQPEVKLGLLPGYGGSQRLPRLVGKGAALQLLLTGDVISAQEALRIGLVNEVVAPERLLPRGREIAQAIASVAPLAVRHCLEAVQHGEDLPLADALYLEAALFGLLCGTEDKTEGTQAFLGKRKPEWKGR